MRFWLCLVLTACGADPQPAPVPVPVVPSRLPAPAPRPPVPPLTAAHGSDIVALGVTADGLAVVSADRVGGIRLWTTLDGTREPTVIQDTAPRSITLAHDGDGFTIGTLDAAGGVHVIGTSAVGAVRARVMVASDRRAAEIDSTNEGLLILWADQTLELVDAAGAVRSRLAADPGTHIDSILVRGRRVLALVQEENQLHGRWIELDHGARWGESTPKFGIRFAHAVLSPEGDLLAVTRPRSLHPVLIDLATGLARKTPLCVTKHWPHEDGSDAGDDSEFLRGDNAPVPLGFLTGTLVACSVVGTLQWWNTGGTPQPTSAGSFSVGAFPAGMSDRALVVGIGANLALGTPTANKFLGYGLHDVAQLRVGSGGVLVGGTDQQSFVLDAGLHERARFELGRSRVDWSDVVVIDERYAITAATRRVPGGRSDSVQVAVFDGVTKTQHQLLPYEMRDKELSYETSTGLLAASDGAASMLLRLDPVTHTFGKPIRLASAILPSKVVVLDPRLANGIAALQIDATNGGLLVGELHEDDLKPSALGAPGAPGALGALVRPRTTYRVPGELRAVDRAGRLYMQGTAEHGDFVTDHDDVVIYVRGAAGARLRGVAALALRPNADGSQIAAFQAPRLVLLTGAGAVRWEAAQWNSVDVGWTAAGELLVQFPSAVARVDLASGALADRRCGWGFGLSDVAFETGRGGPSICDVAR